MGVDDTTADIRRKVASAAELREDGFDMSFGGRYCAMQRTIDGEGRRGCVSFAKMCEVGVGETFKKQRVLCLILLLTPKHLAQNRETQNHGNMCEEL